MPKKTTYKKKKPLIIESDSEVNEDKQTQLELGQEKPKVIKPKKKQTKKVLIKIGGSKNRTKKN